jgi:hypothetical protein
MQNTEGGMGWNAARTLNADFIGFHKAVGAQDFTMYVRTANVNKCAIVCPAMNPNAWNKFEYQLYNDTIGGLYTTKFYQNDILVGTYANAGLANYANYDAITKIEANRPGGGMWQLGMVQEDIYQVV